MRSIARRRRPRHIPSQALLVREWALHLLGTEAGPSDALWREAVGCAPAAWSLFLHLEACAIALQTRLDALGDAAWSRLPAEVTTLIREYATWELRHVLSARAQIRTVARLAKEKGWMIVVLKGGAAVAGGEMIHLGDVDILVERELVDEVAAGLDELGFERRGHDSDTSHHLAARIVPNAVRIEVHRTLKGGQGLDSFRDAALPLEGEPTLWRLGDADNLRYLPVHASIQHPERIGKIRELLLLGHALRSSTPEVVAEVERELAGHESAELLFDMVGAARELHDRTYSGDRFAGVVSRIYLLHYRFGRLSRYRYGMPVLGIAGRILGLGGGHWWKTYTQLYSASTRNRIGFAPLAPLQRYLPPLVAFARQLWRALAFGAATLCAVVVGGEARWAARWAVRPTDPR